MSEIEATSPPPSRTVLDTLAETCRTLALTGLVIITLVQAWQVFARYILNNSPGWTEPVSVFFMGMTVMMAAAVGVRDNTHFSFTNVLEAMPDKIGAIVRVILNVIKLCVAIMLAYWGVELAIQNWDVKMAGADLPAGLRYLPFAIGASVMAIFALERLFVAKKN
jgi:TRAP-type C4-dicarboxylate transport system permease small subunit